jgi:hypothetical protein
VTFASIRIVQKLEAFKPFLHFPGSPRGEISKHLKVLLAKAAHFASQFLFTPLMLSSSKHVSSRGLP